jgi:hypothetical protein
MPPRLLAHRACYDHTRYDNRFQNSPTIVVGLPKLRVLRRRLEETKRGTKQHKGWSAAEATQDPIKGTQHPPTLYLCLGWEVSFTPLRMSWHRAIWVLAIGTTRECSVKPPGPDLYRMASVPIYSMEMHLPMLALICA